jgi:hypothetical protein
LATVTAPLTDAEVPSTIARDSEQQAALDAVLAQTTSVEDLLFHQYVEGPISVTTTLGLFVAMFPLEVVAASVCPYGSSVTASGLNYWAFEFRRTKPNGTGVTIDVYVQKQTSSTPMYAGQDWNLDTSNFDPALRVFDKGDVGALVCRATGTPAALAKLIVCVRYLPL